MSSSPRVSSSSSSGASTTTVVVTEAAPVESTAAASATEPPTLVLRLQPAPKITWTEETVDNEHLGRKSSKRCCIFHKVRKFAESDSDETSSDEEGKNAPPEDGEGEGEGEGKSAGDAGAAGGAARQKASKTAPHLRHHA